MTRWNLARYRPRFLGPRRVWWLLPRLDRRPDGNTLLVVVLFGIACLRLATIAYTGLSTTLGDFFDTLPGPYAEQLNPTLWDSPEFVNDTARSAGGHRHSYGYGPTQYLTLFPIVFPDSYRAIALMLLAGYTLIVLALPSLLWRISSSVLPTYSRNGWREWVVVGTAVFMFFPLLQALVQREFEVVQLFMLVLAVYLLINNREAASAAVIGYIALFKYWPLVLGGYFLLKRRWVALIVLAVTVSGLLLVAHLVFDLAYFPFSNTDGRESQFARLYFGLGDSQLFCLTPTGTTATLRSGVCAIKTQLPWFPALGAFWVLVFTAAVIFLSSFIALERRGIPEDSAAGRWRMVIEFSLIMMAASITVHSHYYYLAVLLIPLTVLLSRYFSDKTSGSRLGQVLTVVAYVLLSVFVLPLSVLSRLLGQDMWRVYLDNGLYLYGLLLLTGLLLWEYAALAVKGPRLQAAK